MQNDYDRRRELQARRSGEKLPENNGGYWSEDDKEFLVLHYYDGDDLSQIALLLKRSETSIFEQLKQVVTVTPVESRRYKVSHKKSCRCKRCDLKGTEACPYYEEDD